MANEWATLPCKQNAKSRKFVKIVGLQPLLAISTTTRGKDHSSSFSPRLLFFLLLFSIFLLLLLNTRAISWQAHGEREIQTQIIRQMRTVNYPNEYPGSPLMTCNRDGFCRSKTCRRRPPPPEAFLLQPLHRVRAPQTVCFQIFMLHKLASMHIPNSHLSSIGCPGTRGPLEFGCFSLDDCVTDCATLPLPRARPGTSWYEGSCWTPTFLDSFIRQYGLIYTKYTRTTHIHTHTRSTFESTCLFSSYSLCSSPLSSLLSLTSLSNP